MATWKKLVVSGSDISQLNNDAGYISASQVPAAANAFSTASINGVELLSDSNQGNFNIVTGSSGTGLTITGTAGTDTISFDLSAIPNSTLANDGITFGTADISLGDTVTQLSLTGFTGSLSATSVLADGVTATTQTAGDNSTKVATTAYVDAVATAADLDLAGDGGTTTAVDLDSETLTFTGADGIEASASAQTITVGIADGGIANAKLANSTISGISLGSDLDSLSVDDSSLQLDTGTEYNGGAARTISVKALGITNTMLAGNITNDKLTNNSITIGDATVALGGSTTLEATGFNSGSFSGSFEGDGSGLTGIASTLNIDSDAGGPSTVDLLTQTLDIAGGTNINTSVGAQTITVNLNDNITVTDATVNGDLTVLGTASFQHETNLEVADRFILLASGSSATGDGGIIVQQATQDVGEVFGFDGIAGTERWGIGQDQHASGSAFTPEAFMAAVLTGNADSDSAIDALVDARYQAKGNLFIGDDQDIWIWS